MHIPSSKILKGRIQGQDPNEFAALCDALIVAEATSAGIPRTCLAVSHEIFDRDGGVDARCQNAPSTSGRLVPLSNVAYQYKSGDSKKTAAAIVKHDIQGKPRVLEALGQG